MTPLYPAQRSPLSNRTIGIVLVFVALLFAGFSVARFLSPRGGLERGQFRIDVVSRSSINNTEGGSLRLSVSDQEKGPIPIVVYYSGGSLSGSVKPAQPNTTSACTIEIIPQIADHKEFSHVTVVSETVETQRSWLGMAKQENRLTSTMQTTLGDKPFHWKTQSGTYLHGTVITLGTVEGSSVKMRVGYAVTTPKRGK
ncbi:MAG: hypothetical protein H8F28_24755 [Fibrella sp.]|nr:hypothetical protein [Armatimonadota bacterium]